MKVPVRVLLGNPAQDRTLSLRGTIYINSHERTECDGGHGGMRTYLEIEDEDATQAWCLTCQGEMMLRGALLSVQVVRQDDQPSRYRVLLDPKA